MIKVALTSNGGGVEQTVDKKKEKRGSHLRERRKDEGKWESRHMDETVIVRVSAHMPAHALLMKLIEIEPLKALSPFCSGGQLMATQTKTKPSQTVSLPFIIVRTTAATLPISPQSPQVCVCVLPRILHLTLYIPQRRQFTMM